jgi:RNA polymerase sigma factor (sigma-70 family)
MDRVRQGCSGHEGAIESSILEDEVVVSMVATEALHLHSSPVMRSETVEDVHHELSVGLLQRERRYRPRRPGDAARAWARPVIRSIARDQLRTRGRLKRRSRRPVVSLDAIVENTPRLTTVGELLACQKWGPLEHAQANEEREILGQVLACLPPHLRKLTDLLQEDSKCEARARTGLGRRPFDAHIDEIRLRFERAGLGPNPPERAHTSDRCRT